MSSIAQPQPQNSEPLIGNASDNATSNISEYAANAGEQMSNTLTSLQNSVKDSLDNFSQKNTVDAGNEFLNSNGILAKFTFIILILFGFMFLLNLGMHIIGYFSTSSKNPILVNGKLNGQDSVIIPQNPSNKDSKTIYRSNNQASGAEFTWSSWLYLNPNTTPDKLYHIFSKGNGKRSGITSEDNNEHLKVSNGPGMYSKTDTNGNNYLIVKMDNISSIEETIEINNFPLKKWVHVAIRLQNKKLDIYINGVVSARKQMDKIPKQNYHHIAVGGGGNTGGFSGSISNLQYFQYALNVFEINNIVMKGPNTNSSDLSSDSKASSGNYSYLANQWYKNAS